MMGMLLFLFSVFGLFDFILVGLTFFFSREQVPAHLKIIHEAFALNKAFELDGIFRQAGAEEDMKSLIGASFIFFFFFFVCHFNFFFFRTIE